MSCTSILRIGPSADNASSDLLRKALLSHFETSHDRNVLTVSNRYFSAFVLLHEIGSCPPQDIFPKEDGVILVFDAIQSHPDCVGSNPASFDALTLVHEVAENSDMCGELLRLCVGVCVGSKSPLELRGHKHEEEYSRRVLWCLDRGYEYVEVDLSEHGQTTGHDDRDKDGFARVVEAISGTVWSSAKMASHQHKQLTTSYQVEKETITTHDNPYIPPDPSTFAAGNDSVVDSIVEPSAPVAPKEVAADTIQASLVNETKLDFDSGFAEDETDSKHERILENLAGAVREASRIREASRSGELTDDERRQRATDAAMLMMGLMDQLDMGGEDSDGPDCSSDDDE